MCPTSHVLLWGRELFDKCAFGHMIGMTVIVLMCMLATSRKRQQEDTILADPTVFDYLIQDDQGLTNRHASYWAYNGATETVDALIGNWTEVGGLLDAVIDGQILNGRITIPLTPDPTWKSAPAEGNNVNQVMALSFENDFNRFLTTLIIPAYKETMLNADGSPNLAATALAAFIARMIDDSGVTAFGNSRDLHQLDALASGYLSVRKVRNQRVKTKSI